jgi:hypothetical protein
LVFKPKNPQLLFTSSLLVGMKQHGYHANKWQRYAKETDEGHEGLNISTIHL